MKFHVWIVGFICSIQMVAVANSLQPERSLADAETPTSAEPQLASGAEIIQKLKLIHRTFELFDTHQDIPTFFETYRATVLQREPPCTKTECGLPSLDNLTPGWDGEDGLKLQLTALKNPAFQWAPLEYVNLHNDNETYYGFHDPEGVYQELGYQKLHPAEFRDIRIEYFGHFLNGQKHGIGWLSSGEDLYRGEWRFDDQHGVGFLETSEGETYNGEWKSGAYDGFGILKYPDLTTYVGHFQQGSPHGYGVFRTFENTYKGFWRNGKRHGNGKVISNEDGHVIVQGRFAEDKLFAPDRDSAPVSNSKKKKKILPVD